MIWHNIACSFNKHNGAPQCNTTCCCYNDNLSFAIKMCYDKTKAQLLKHENGEGGKTIETKASIEHSCIYLHRMFCQVKAESTPLHIKERRRAYLEFILKCLHVSEYVLVYFRSAVCNKIANLVSLYLPVSFFALFVLQFRVSLFIFIYFVFDDE